MKSLWFVIGIVMTVVYLIAGFGLWNAGINSSIWFFLIAFLSIIGIIQYYRGRYEVTKVLWRISGVMGFPLGILLIVAGTQVGKLAAKVEPAGDQIDSLRL